MFFDQLMNLFKGPEPEADAVGDLRMAAAILLLEAAQRDENFDAAERATIERLLTERFSLSPDECARLMAVSEAASARTVQLYPHTQAVFQHMTPEERVGFVCCGRWSMPTVCSTPKRTRSSASSAA